MYSLTVKGKTVGEVLEKLETLQQALLNGSGPASVTLTARPQEEKISIPKKKKAKAEPEETFELGDESTEDSPKAKAPILSLDKDIIPAFQKYSSDHSRDQAIKVLKKFKVASVYDLKPEIFLKVLEELQ